VVQTEAVVLPVQALTAYALAAAPVPPELATVAAPTMCWQVPKWAPASAPPPPSFAGRPSPRRAPRSPE
jgi:hypothetical protein